LLKTEILKVIYIIALIILYGSVNAKELDGYIITKNGDKKHGFIQVSSVNYPNGDVIVNNINYLPFYVSVLFKESGTKTFIEYFAQDIEGFSFIYGGQEIFFFSIQLPYQSWGKPKYRKKFLRLIVNGTLILFDHKRQVYYGYNYTESTEYFISDQLNRIIDVSDNDYPTLEEFLLKECKMDQEFIRNQPYKINVRNLKEIIYNYNRWVNSPNIISD